MSLWFSLRTFSDVTEPQSRLNIHQLMRVVYYDTQQSIGLYYQDIIDLLQHSACVWVLLVRTNDIGNHDLSSIITWIYLQNSRTSWHVIINSLIHWQIRGYPSITCPCTVGRQHTCACMSLCIYSHGRLLVKMTLFSLSLMSRVRWCLPDTFDSLSKDNLFQKGDLTIFTLDRRVSYILVNVSRSYSIAYRHRCVQDYVTGAALR